MNYIMTPQIINFLIVTVVCIFIYLGVNRHIESISRKLNGDNKNLVEGKLKALNQLIVFIIYFFYILDFFVDVKVCAASLVVLVVATLITFKNQINSQAKGYFTIVNNDIAVNDEVIINNKYKGRVQSITLSSVEVLDISGEKLIISHSEINLIQRFPKEYRNVTVSVVLSTDENPEKVEDIFIKLMEKLNEKFKDYLFQGPERLETATFIYEGITNLNTNNQGTEYCISGKVKPFKVEEIQKKLNREIAVCCYKNQLKKPER
ncbi:mechanosensitive ion channel [Priestia aryabhattai]|uniref:Mechanosensitive ion channel n=1 Tax=Priestia aryabhattai TaxID=412384 RepID=A0AAX6NBE9_PRIAR|nr:mechanosensitive ion channel domain-containing protein [Priestia aryabhattai]MDU9693218.1 mechanosensitive ion channel [Priestia aryabhattai]